MTRWDVLFFLWALALTAGEAALVRSRDDGAAPSAPQYTPKVIPSSFIVSNITAIGGGPGDAGTVCDGGVQCVSGICAGASCTGP